MTQSPGRRDLGGIKLHHALIFGSAVVGLLFFLSHRSGAMTWSMQAVQQQTELVDAEVQALKQLSQLEAQLQTERREAATAASAAQERMAKLEKDLAAAVAAAGTAAGGAAAATPATGAVDPAIAECMKAGAAYTAKLEAEAKVEGSMEDYYMATFSSPVSKDLDNEFYRLARLVGTDKATTHSYHYAYTRYLSHARYRPMHILEIGLGCNMGYGPGASLRLWKAYLPCTKISYVEYNKECAEKWKDYIEKEAGGTLYIGSQDNVELLEKIAADAKAFGGFDMIVDDGSHIPQHLMVSLEHLWKAVRPGGVYVMEDLHDHWRYPRDYDQREPPTLVVPLFERLIHTINCQSSSYSAYDESAKAWCRKEQLTQYKDVARVDCMRELCGMVKQTPMNYVT